MTLRTRHVIYVPGYDPRGVAHYYRLFRQELGRFGALHGLDTTIGRPVTPPGGVSSLWAVGTEGPGWRVEARYEVLRWDDLVRADMARPVWRRAAAAWVLLARALGSGALARMARAHWRFAVFYLYPYVVFLAIATASALVGVGAAIVLAAVGMPMLGWAAGAVVAGLALVAGLRLSESRTYAMYLFDDGVATDAYVRRRRPDWEARLAAFAARIVAIAQAGEADEIVVVGHSSGSFMAVDVLAQALARDPALGRHGAAVSLVTLGANLPLVGFSRAGGWFVEKLRQVLAAPDLSWLDVQSRKDVMSFHPFDQAAGHGLEGPRLRTVSVRFRDVLLPRNYAAFRWRFLRVHFQYLMANERKAGWDYYMLVCGPQSMAEATAALGA